MRYRRSHVNNIEIIKLNVKWWNGGLDSLKYLQINLSLLIIYWLKSTFDVNPSKYLYLLIYNFALPIENNSLNNSYVNYTKLSCKI